MAKHLLLKNGRLYFRRRIPSRLTAQLGRSDFVRLLPPCTHHDAVQIARALSAQLDQAFAQAMTDSTIDRDKLNELARLTFSEFLKEYDWLNRRPHSEKGAEINAWRCEGARELLRMKFWQDAVPTAEQVMAEHGVSAPFQSPEFIELCFKLLRANAEAARISAARFDGDYTAAPADPLFFGCDIDPPPPSLSLEEAFEKYRTEKQASGDWRAEALRENENTFSLLAGHFGEIRISAIKRKRIAEFLDLIRRLPKKRGKSDALRRLSLQELAEMVDAGELEPIGQTTVAKHMKNVVALLHWAVRQGEITENPAVGVYKPSKRIRSANEERASWSASQLQILFSCPLYRGGQSLHRRFKSGKMVVQDAWYWLPLFMAFHPVRPEEIAQLQLTDVVETNGTIVIDINGGITPEEVAQTGKQVKNVASRRQVPVHAVLCDLGFSEYVRKISADKNARLFPDLTAQGKADRYGQYICKRLNVKFKAMGIEGISIYGLRHTAITSLANTCDNETMRRRLQGHTLQGEDGRYIKGFEVSRLKEAIDGIQYPGIDADFIRGA